MSYPPPINNLYNGLPSRPAAGPSAQPYGQQSQRPQQSFHPQQPAYPIHPGVPQPMPQYNTSGGYNPYGGVQYNPLAAYQTFGRSLFQQPQATPEGYTYSSTYNAAPTPLPGYEESLNGSAPSNKRARLSTHTSAIGGGDSTGAWRNCSIQGCKYVGSAHDVEIHEEDRHLIYKPGKVPQRSEEEERFARRKGPPPAIEGTNITLQTEEDIAKWIAERKAKWPSAKRVAEKDEERKAAIERGEFPPRGGRGGSRGRGGRANNPAAMAEDWGRAPVERDHDNTRGRGRGRGRGNERGRGGRGGQMNAQSRGQVEGWVKRPLPDAPDVISTKSSDQASPIDRKLDTVSGFSGVAAYASSEEADSGSESSSSSSDSSSDGTSDMSESDEDDDRGETGETVVEQTEDQQPERALCKNFARTGKCKWGEKCHFSHKSVGGDNTNVKPNAPVEKKRMPKQPPHKRANPFDRPSMLGALLATPINNTLSQLSQTIRFLVANNMLENVELTPGQAEDEEKEKNKVVEVPETEEHVLTLPAEMVHENEEQA